MIRTAITTILVAGVAGLGGWAFVDQSRQADATVSAADAAPVAARGDRLDVAAPSISAAVDQRLASPEAHIQQAYATVMASNAKSRFKTVAVPHGHQATMLIRVPVDN
jgi:hypothetical protein